MIQFIKFTLFSAVLYFVLFTGLKTATYQNFNLGKNKLHQYFKQNHSNANDLANNSKQLIIDSLSQIQQNSANIDFVEVSEFTDSLSIRWITSNDVSYSNFVKFNSKTSKHISTTYLSVSKDYSFVNFDLKKVLSVMKFNLMYRNQLKTKNVIGDYLISNTKNCSLFYLKGGNVVNDISSNLGNSKYQFSAKEADNNSLYMVRYLLSNYSFENFEKLWENGFSRFAEIYGKTYKLMTQDRDRQALLTSKNSTSINWEKFNRCNHPQAVKEI